MGITAVEELVATVKSILKTIECPIWSVQEAVQRQSIISAARLLAQTCGSLTGINFFSSESSTKLGENPCDELPVPSSKKLKVTPESTESTGGKKRKSCEKKDNASVDQDDSKSNEGKNGVQAKNDCNVLSDDESSVSKKRICQNSDDDDDDLPTLQELLTPSTVQKTSHLINKENVEKPLTIFSPDKFSCLKTYSRAHKIKEQIASDSDKKFNSVKENSDDNTTILNKKNSNSAVESNPAEDNIKNCCIKLTKTNALKNKTSKLKLDMIQDDGFLSKPVLIKDRKSDELMKNKQDHKSKENELLENTCAQAECNSSPTGRYSMKSKKLRRSIKKGLNKSQKNRKSSTSDLSENGNPLISEITSEKEDSECLILNETTLTNVQIPTEKSVEDPFKAIGLIDTAVFVDSVTSPLTAKPLSLKSPGWSRVKKVKKDFKVKKFSLLNVEKNSPHISHKNSTVCTESVASEQEPTTDSSFRKNVEKHSSEQIDLNANENNLHSINAIKSIANCDYKEPPLLDLNNVETVADNMEIENIIFGCEQVAGNTVASNMKPIDASGDSERCPRKSGVMNCVSASIENYNFSIINEKESCEKDELSRNICNAIQTLNDPNENSNISLVLNNSNHFNTKIKENCFKNQNETTFDQDLVMEKDNQIMLTSVQTLSECQNIPIQPALNNEKDVHLVEHSQQTSQTAFCFDNQNMIYGNFPLIAQQQPVYNINLNTEKTKVVKRACLTLEEIQDSFFKSNQSDFSETIYSAPFLSEQFKLHICVSEETLNISVLKVINPSVETSTTVNIHPIFSEKYIQTSNSFPYINSPTVLTSSNAASESSQQDPSDAPDPFPYLNKCSTTEGLQNTTAEESVAVPELLMNDDAETCKLSFNHIEDDKNERDIEMKDLNESEIIHFPPKSPCSSDKEFQLHAMDEDLYKTQPAPVVTEVQKSKEDHNFEDEHCVEHDLPKESELEENVEIRKSPGNFTLHNSCDENHPIEQDLPKEVEMVEERKSPEHCDPYDEIPPEKKNRSSTVRYVESDSESLDSDSELPLKKLQQCASKHQNTAKKSRLSLKMRKSKLRRTQKLESSDESDLEAPTSKKEPESKENNQTSNVDECLEDDASKQVSALKSGCSAKESVAGDKAKNVLDFSSIGEVEMPSTLSSVFSEDAPEANASEIILEIEDLADKIKSLEDRLKQCGHSNAHISPSNGPKDSNKVKESCESVFHVDESDSEDSTDLFPQSVPPTPPQSLYK